MNKRKIIVVGGGFAGVNFIKGLENNPKMEVTVVDKNNYHFFPPLLYQVATAFIEPSNISHPFRRLLRGKENIRFHMGKLLRVNHDNNTIDTENGTLPYDYLVLAMGTQTNYFGIEGVQKWAFPMKTIDEALVLRNHLLLNMEKAVRAKDNVERDKFLNIVIAGGGPTGVELAGMLAELGDHVAAKEYPELKDYRSHIYLVDAGPVLLSPMSKKAQSEATDVLKKLGVHIILNTAVKDYTGDTVILSDGTSIQTYALLWASGVIAHEVPGLPADVFTRGRRIQVDEINRVTGFDNIFALGDQCFQTTDTNFPNGHPQVAQVAIQQGTLLASNLKKLANGQQPRSFGYNDKGSMAIIAKYKAVADLPKLSFKGFFAWVIWLFIHIIPLVGFRNKAKLAGSWLWSFITNNPTLRLIIRPGSERS